MKNPLLIFLFVLGLMACSKDEPESGWHSGADTELIAFIRRNAANTRSQIYVMNPDGSNVRLQGNGGVRVETNVAWSPDGKSIAYRADPGLTEESRICIMSATGVVNKPMERRIFLSSFTWSPDGFTLAFDSQYGMSSYGNDRIYLSDVNSPEIFTTSPLLDTSMYFDRHPSWSPDGKKIAFVSNRLGDGSVDLYVMNPDGSEVERITHDPMYEFRPAWSPDGRKIAFYGWGGGNQSWSIYVIDADGSNLFQVTHNLSNEIESLTWSPDATRIAFVSDHEGDSEIYVINIDGTGLKRLTHHPGPDYSPSWSPGK